MHSQVVLRQVSWRAADALDGLDDALGRIDACVSWGGNMRPSDAMASSVSTGTIRHVENGQVTERIVEAAKSGELPFVYLTVCSAKSGLRRRA